MTKWYAVQTKPRQERAAERNLQQQGYSIYSPKVLLRKRKRGKWAKVVEPLFPRYLFIQVDPDQRSLAPVRSTVGVAGLVRFGQLLQPVPDAVITFLQQSENPETHQVHADEWPHQPGDAVAITQGPFAGLTAIFESASGEERAVLLLEILGRQNMIDVPMDALAVTK